MEEVDWEEWDGSSPFWVHCVAGSAAGVAEHTAVYPLDTVRTNIQVFCSACARNTNNLMMMQSHVGRTLRGNHHRRMMMPPPPPPQSVGMWQTMRFLMNEPAVATTTCPKRAPQTMLPLFSSSLDSLYASLRLWRGVQTMLIGCIPAHALYFSSYEMVKHATTLDQEEDGGGGGKVTTTMWGCSLAGAAATLGHDVIMTPMDTLKQRLQLGHYNSMGGAFSTILQQEGTKAFYRSFSVTLATNVPYGMLMVATNEGCKQALQGADNKPSLSTILISSSLAGFVASALTTPLDRIKTTLQTQELAPTCFKKLNPAACARPEKKPVVVLKTWQEAARFIYQTEGVAGFGRGILPRVMSHTPAVAISWTTYETAKQALMRNSK